jgi:hypothetical protein
MSFDQVIEAKLFAGSLQRGGLLPIFGLNLTEI